MHVGGEELQLTPGKHLSQLEDTLVSSLTHLCKGWPGVSTWELGSEIIELYSLASSALGELRLQLSAQQPS